MSFNVVMTRKQLTTKQRVELFKAHSGICHICNGAIHTGKKWEVEHIIPLALGGEDSLDNMAPAHSACHTKKTANEDVPAIARAKRREARNIGAEAKPRQPLPNKPTAKREPRSLAAGMPVLPRKPFYREAGQ